MGSTRNPRVVIQNSLKWNGMDNYVQRDIIEDKENFPNYTIKSMERSRLTQSNSEQYRLKSISMSGLKHESQHTKSLHYRSEPRLTRTRSHNAYQRTAHVLSESKKVHWARDLVDVRFYNVPGEGSWSVLRKKLSHAVHAIRQDIDF